MTPLHLEILLHYYTRGGDFEALSTNATRNNYAYDLAKDGLLYSPQDGDEFAITEYGKRCMQFALNAITPDAGENNGE